LKNFVEFITDCDDVYSFVAYTKTRKSMFLSMYRVEKEKKN